MNCLVITTPTHDLASLFLYDGLIELLGTENVYCAEEYPFFSNMAGGGGRILWHNRIAEKLPVVLGRDDGPFDLVVLHSCFLRERDWPWAVDLVHRHLAPHGVVAYVEGGDAAVGEVFPPPPGLHVHRVFRREILPGFAYPYHPTPLQWGIPSWWLDEPRHGKCFDTSLLCSIAGHPLRWQAMQGIFRAGTRHHTLVGGCVPLEEYLLVTGQTKFVIVPPGGGSDCIRQWEAIGAGAIPIFVGHPPRVREPWFAADEVFECAMDDLPETIDHALGHVDFFAMQQRLEKRAKAEHTTLARARRVVELTGAHD